MKICNMLTPPPLRDSARRHLRSSNLELYRIICMLMIVAHHYVVNSGLTCADGPLETDPSSANSIFLRLFGMWGKTGINCFLMITGYFMCTSQISFKKILKLLLQIYLYKLLLFSIFLFMGYETITITRIVKLIMPFWGFKSNFIGCFLIFYLTIPFWNILIRNMNQRQHLILLTLLLSCYTLLGSIPTFYVSFNYITWFGIIYLISSYIRLFPNPLFEKKKLWGWMTLLSCIMAMIGVLVAQRLFSSGYYFVADCNKFFAVLVAVCSFLWFKNIELKYSKVINAMGAATFGVLVIHANSNAMRTWLWKDVVDSVGHSTLPFWELILYSVGVVIAIFMICNIIDQIRIATLEKVFFNWYDKHVSSRVDVFIDKILTARH